MGLCPQYRPQKIMNESLKSLQKYVTKEEVREHALPLDIPAGITVLTPEHPDHLTPVMMYVIGTATPRIGRASDISILTDLLENKKYHVILVDYFNHPDARPHGLDWSLEAIRTDIPNLLEGIPYNRAWYYILPAGYNIKLNEFYWAYDLHGTVGTFERIVNIWNHDFRSCKANAVIHYPDGTEKRVGDTEAHTIYDCVKKDGSPIDMNLYLDLIYPVDPDHDVPVMILSSSSQTRVDCWAGKRPHLTGFLFAGYAGAIYDYSYTPMARDDHYGYYDGNWAPGHITGDNYTYSMGVYNSVIAETAAIRRIRYLARQPGSIYHFDVDHMGVYGNSKGGLCTRLGHQHPETLRGQRYFENECGTTRYEAGQTADDGRGIIRGGKPQPWLTYPDGTRIPSNVQFVYANCGGNYEYITEGHAPTYATGSMKDGSYFGFFPGVVNACRSHNVPSLHYSLSGLGHALGFGEDKDYGVDTYRALFDIAHYWLHGDAAVYQYTAVDKKDGKIAPDAALTVTVSGPVPADQIRKLTPTDTKGRQADGVWESSYGGCTWIFRPTFLVPGETYTSATTELLAENGKAVCDLRPFTFTVDAGVGTRLSSDTEGYLLVKGKKAVFRVANDAHNTLRLLADGKEIGTVRLCGAGLYTADLPAGAAGKHLTFVPVRAAGTYTVFDKPLATLGADEVTYPDVINHRTEGDAIIIDSAGLNDNPYSPWVVGFSALCSFPKVMKTEPLDASDYGRTFRLSLTCRDTTSRVLNLFLNKRAVPCDKENPNYEGIDFYAQNASFRTEAGKPVTRTLSYTVDHDCYWRFLDKRVLTLSGETTTVPGTKMYFPLVVEAVWVEEIVTDADVADVFVL